MKTKFVTITGTALIIASVTLVFAACKPSSNAQTGAKEQTASPPPTNTQVTVAEKPQSPPPPTNAETTTATVPQSPVASPPAQNIKADTVEITDGGMGTKIYSKSFSAPLNPNGGLGSPQANGPIIVYIFRNLDAFREAGQLGIHVGGVYLHPEPGVFRFIRDVDLHLTDHQLCQQFGIQIAEQDSTANKNASPLSSAMAKVVQMSKASIGEDVIVAFVENSWDGSSPDFEQILYLKQQGVSQKVIEAMINQSTPTTANH